MTAPSARCGIAVHPALVSSRTARTSPFFRSIATHLSSGRSATRRSLELDPLRVENFGTVRLESAWVLESVHASSPSESAAALRRVLGRLV